MKSLKTILGICLATAGLGGAIAVGAVSTQSASIEKVDAAGSSSGYVFVDISNTTSYSGGIYCHNWGTKGTNWPGTKMTLLQDNIYYCELADSSNNLLIFNNGSGVQTGDTSINSKFFYMDSDTGCHADDKSTARMDYVVGTSTTPSSNTTRLFFHHDYCGNWKTDSTSKVRCWGSSSYVECVDAYLYDLSFFENNGTGASGQWYGYVDVPKDITGWQLVRANSSYGRDLWNFMNGNVTGSYSSRIWRLKENDWSWSWDTDTGDSKPGASLMSKIVEAIDTCSSDVRNGYGAYSSLNSNFYSKATSLGKSQTVKSLGGKTATVQAHFEGMSRRPASLPGSNNIIIDQNNNTPVLIAVIASITTITALGTFLIIRKKKHN